MRVRYTPRAHSDLQGIPEYLDERSPKGALNVKGILQSTLKLIGQFPESGRSVTHRVRVLPVGRYPYLVYWTIERGEAWIVHIRHGRANRGSLHGSTFSPSLPINPLSAS